MPIRTEAAERGIAVDTRKSPRPRLRSVALSAVKMLPSFWHDRTTGNARVTLSHAFEKLKREGRLERSKNAHIPAARGKNVRLAGEAWLYQRLEAAGMTMLTWPALELAPMAEGMIDLIERAQFEDGYIGLAIRPGRPEERRKDPRSKHELFAAGHLFQTGIARRFATRSEPLFEMARRLVNQVVAESDPG